MVAEIAVGLAANGEAHLGKTPTRLLRSAIFAGVVIAIAVRLMLGIPGPGIGLTMVDPV